MGQYLKLLKGASPAPGRFLKGINSGKTPGLDGVTKEHLTFAGKKMFEVLCLIFNWIVVSEYIPINFHRGVQIPLYKGKTHW